MGRTTPAGRTEAEGLDILREIASAIVHERNVRKLLCEVLEILGRRMGVKRGTFCLLEGDELRIEATTNDLDADERSHGRYRLGEGVTGMVAKTGRPETVPDVRRDRRFLNRTGARASGEAVSFICVPLLRAGQVIGTLSADRERCGDDSSLERDAALLGIVANMAAEAASVFREECAEREALLEENRRLRGAFGGNPGGIVGDSPAMRAVYEQIRLVAPSDATVLVRGASGTGKELVARAIQGLSQRKDGPFVVLNCAALPEALVESELFGHEKGAFTDARERRIGRAEAANGGTLFLDEIGDLPVAVQVKLLRFLQDRTFSRVGSNEVLRSDVRFIAATSRDLEDLMARKLFREDLYYRISVFPVAMPPLSERGGDAMLLAEHFLAKMNARCGRSVSRISTPAAGMILSYPWPGNVRELENCIERAVLTAKDGCVRSYDLPPAVRRAGSGVEEDPFRPDAPPTLDEQVAAFERRILEDALVRHGWNRAAAGPELGVSPRMMNYRIARAGLAAPAKDGKDGAHGAKAP